VKTGNPNIVVAAAAERPKLSLADALLVLLVFARARARRPRRPPSGGPRDTWPRSGRRRKHARRISCSARHAHSPVRAPDAGREALLALGTRRRLAELCRALAEWEPPER
jgi:hypothetical protein